MENLYKNFIKIDIMSNLNLENIVGFKAVDKDGNEQNVTVDEMVDMVSTRMVMALSETSTFAAAAATGNDVYENELPTVTDAANVRVLQSSGDAAQMTMQSLASKLGELLNIDKVVMPRGTLADCDNATNGIYYINGTITNAPISFGVLISFIDTVKTNYGFQIAMQTWGGVIYVRSRTEVLTSWTSWYKLSATIAS